MVKIVCIKPPKAVRAVLRLVLRAGAPKPDGK